MKKTIKKQGALLTLSLVLLASNKPVSAATTPPPGAAGSLSTQVGDNPYGAAATTPPPGATELKHPKAPMVTSQYSEQVGATTPPPGASGQTVKQLPKLVPPTPITSVEAQNDPKNICLKNAQQEKTHFMQAVASMKFTDQNGRDNYINSVETRYQKAKEECERIQPEQTGATTPPPGAALKPKSADDIMGQLKAEMGDEKWNSLSLEEKHTLAREKAIELIPRTEPTVDYAHKQMGPGHQGPPEPATNASPAPTGQPAAAAPTKTEQPKTAWEVAKEKAAELKQKAEDKARAMFKK